MTTVYLHVGAHKTASSSIQDGLSRYREELLAHGIKFSLLPGPNGKLMENHSSLFYSLFSDEPTEYHINIMYGITTADAVHQLNKRYQEFLANEAKRFTEEAIVFSGEDMILLRDSGVRRLSSFLSQHFGPGTAVKVVCYLRAPHDWFASLVQQWVRGGEVLEDALRIKFPDIRAHIEPFVRHFGKTNVLIKKFEDAVEHQAGPFGHFLSQISEGFDTSRIRSRLVNAALSAEGVQLVSALNAAERVARKGLPLGVAREYLTPFFRIRGPKFVLPISTQERVWKEARESLEWIESSFEIEMYREFEYIESSRPAWDEDALLSLAELVRGNHK